MRCGALESQQDTAGQFRAKTISVQQGDETRAVRQWAKKHNHPSDDTLIQYGGKYSRSERRSAEDGHAII
jgi:hypothetical protein